MCCVIKGGGGVEVDHVAKKYVRVCARNYSGSLFTVLGRGPILGTSPVPGPVGNWGD